MSDKKSTVNTSKRFLKFVLVGGICGTMFQIIHWLITPTFPDDGYGRFYNIIFFYTIIIGLTVLGLKIYFRISDRNLFSFL